MNLQELKEQYATSRDYVSWSALLNNREGVIEIDKVVTEISVLFAAEEVKAAIENIVNSNEYNAKYRT